MGEFLTGRRVVAGALALSLGGMGLAGCGGKEVSKEATPVATSVASSHEATPTPTESTLPGIPACHVLEQGDTVHAPEALNDKWPVAIMTGVKLNSHEAKLRPYLGKIGKQYGIALTSPNGRQVTKVVPFGDVEVWGHGPTSRTFDFCKPPEDLGKYESYVQGITLENRRVKVAGIAGTRLSFAEAKEKPPVTVDQASGLTEAKLLSAVDVPTTPSGLAKLGYAQAVNN